MPWAGRFSRVFYAGRRKQERFVIIRKYGKKTENEPNNRPYIGRKYGNVGTGRLFWHKLQDKHIDIFMTKV